MAFTESFHFLNPSLVILLQKLQPVVAILLAAIVLKEPITWNEPLGGAIVILGNAITQRSRAVR